MLHVMIIALPETAGITTFHHVLQQERLSEPWADSPSSWSIAEVCPKQASPPRSCTSDPHRWPPPLLRPHAVCGHPDVGQRAHSCVSGAVGLSLGTKFLLQDRLGLSLQLTVNFQCFCGGICSRRPDEMMSEQEDICPSGSCHTPAKKCQPR